MPNQCCAHGAMHCTVPGVGAGMPDPSTGMMPPIDPGMAAMGMGGLYDARTPHGGIKQKVTILTYLHIKYFKKYRKQRRKSGRICTTRRGPGRL